MKVLFYCTGVLLLLSICFQPVRTHAQVVGKGEPSLMFTPAQLKEDFHIVRNALEEGHPGVYRYVSKARLDRKFDAAEKKLDHPMDVYGFFRILAPMVAAIKCGHTGVNLPTTESERFGESERLLPFQVKMVGKKVYVFRDYASEDGTLAGSEIRAINGMPTEKIVASLLPAMPGDGEIPTSRLRQVGQIFNRGLSILLGMTAPYEVAYCPAGTENVKHIMLSGLTLSEIAKVSKAKYPQDDQGPDHPADLTFLDENKIAVMAIYNFGGFADKEQKKPLAVFLDEAFAQFEQKGTKTLILDVRNNGGGKDALGKQLFSYLTDKPFTYYSDLVINALDFPFMAYATNPPYHLSIPENEVQKMPDGHYRNTSHPNWGLQAPRKPTFTGKVFILMNGGSFSTTCEFLSIAHFHHRAVFIGEEAGGGYYGNNSGYTRLLTLPNTKATVRVPFMKYVMAVSGYRYPKRGVMPDYPVQPTIADLLAGRDPEMQKALALARKMP